jgi:hypothetical protein
MPGGAIAQLGERLLCKQEVVGSIPSGSTIFGRSRRELDDVLMRFLVCPIWVCLERLHWIFAREDTLLLVHLHRKEGICLRPPFRRVLFCALDGRLPNLAGGDRTAIGLISDYLV